MDSVVDGLGSLRWLLELWALRGDVHMAVRLPGWATEGDWGRSAGKHADAAGADES